MSCVENPTWAKSANGRNIALYMSAEPVKNPVIVIGGVHGDEPEGVALAEAVLQWLKKDSESDKKVTIPWIVIPCINPDGYLANQRVNGNGVDLNRNYPSADWTPEYAQERYFPGKQPASEPEIQALVRLFKDTNPRLVIHCHSWNPCIVYAGEPAKSAAEALGRSSGYQVQTEIGYPTPGALSRYGWFDCKIPIICIEEKQNEAPEKIWPHFKNGFAEIFQQKV